MASKSFYSSRPTGPGAVAFEVRPAGSSVTFVIVSALGFVVLAAMLAIVGSLVTQSGSGALLGVGASALYFWMYDWQKFWSAARYRRPAQIQVSPEGLVSGSQRFALQEIAAVDVRAPARSAETAPIVMTQPGVVFIGSPGAVMVAGAQHDITNAVAGTFAAGHAVGAQLGNGARRKQAERSYTITLRRAGNSGTTVLAGGLTVDCARALAVDLSNALQQASACAHYAAQQAYGYAPVASPHIHMPSEASRETS